jgi:hypothetical protein
LNQGKGGEDGDNVKELRGTESAVSLDWWKNIYGIT